MPTYEWICECGRQTNRVRPMRDYQVPPQSPCQGCQKPGPWTKKISIPCRITEGFKPFVMTAAPYWENGVKKYPAFNTKSEYDEFMKRHDFVNPLDGEDPAIGPSQRSVHDSFIDPPPPSERALEISEGVQYLSESEVEASF